MSQREFEEQDPTFSSIYRTSGFILSSNEKLCEKKQSYGVVCRKQSDKHGMEKLCEKKTTLFTSDASFQAA